VFALLFVWLPGCLAAWLPDRAGGIGGPLRLRLTVTPDLLAAINAAVAMEVQAA
jgi:hypothetical protein